MVVGVLCIVGDGQPIIARSVLNPDGLPRSGARQGEILIDDSAIGIENDFERGRIVALGIGNARVLNDES